MKGRALLCLTGQTGAGKTTLGREIRRRGLPGFRPTEIAVIDDGVMTAPLFGFINRRVRLPCRERDDLSPFEPYLRGKKLVVYVAIRPEERISRCDVLLRLRCDDKARRERLVSSREDGAARYEKSLRKTDAVTLEADHCFDLRSDSGALWDQL
jgi:broad-specificity NMP kinase